ncbi:hypothetical protein ACIQTX_18915 [Microbacterium sp. NPDC090281]|uniref:hypothetical protein n=1 Tax=Microbacterium sp. NPDC090281 TaxID=3364208 RepID=UPI003819B160
MHRILPEGPGLPAPLVEVQTSRLPEGPLPPGPRANAWERAGAVADDPPVGVRELVDGLWHPGEFHRTTDGRATRIRRRPVPSAGACYPVQTHLIDASGLRWAVDHERGVFHRRDPAADRADGWPSIAADDGIARAVFTVLPGRSFGRYRHRAWPLWIADAAYAVAALRFLLGERAGATEVGPSTRLRSLLGVPRAGDVDAWMRRGLVPEIPLAAVEIPRAPVPDPTALHALGARRSPDMAEFTARIGVAPAPEVGHIARASGQAWVRGATEARSWSVPITAPSTVVGAALWSAHLAAARLCYEAALTGDRGTRPVSGFSSTGDRWILHALAFLDSPGGAR